jgi:hypothetical protein
MKKRRFDEGGDVDDSLLSNKDNFKSIGDDTRSRAKKFLETGKKDVEESKSSPTKSSPTKSLPVKTESKTESKTEDKDYSDQNDRRSQQSGYESSSNQKRLREYDKPLEEVHPEDYVPGGMLKNIARRAIKSAVKDITPKAPQLGGLRKQLGYDKEVANRRSFEGYSPEEAIAARKSADDVVKESVSKRSDAAKKGIEAKSERTKSSGAMKDDFKTSEIRSGYKSGGEVAGKLATRGYGISKHGKAK